MSLPMLKYKDFILERKIDQLIYQLSTDSINENRIIYQIEELKNHIHTKEDAEKVLDIVLRKVSNLNSLLRKRILKYIIIFLLSFLTIAEIYDHIHSPEIKKEVMEIKPQVINKFDVFSAHISKDGIQHIKNYEKLSLKAYKLGDNKITCGWGHAEPTSHSKYHIGHRITIETAEKLFRKDIITAESGVKRMLDDWKNEGYTINFTQQQFDVLVSLAFNMGVSGLRQTEFAKILKGGEIEEAGERIKTTGVSDSFAGLSVRREKEAEQFLANVNV